MIGSGEDKLENKPRRVARNTWSRFPVSVINSFVCETDEIDICAFPFQVTSTAVFLVDSGTWIPLRDRSLMILYNKGINFEIACEFYILPG